MGLRYFAFGILLIFNFAYNDAIFIKLTNVVCETFNKTWITFHECRLRAISRQKTVLNINATFIYPANDIVVDFQTLKKANGYKPWLFNFSINACRFIEKPYNPAVMIVFKMFREFSNINHSCPYVGPQILKDFYPRAETIGLPLPTGDYLLNIHWRLHKRPMFNTNVYFAYSED